MGLENARSSAVWLRGTGTGFIAVAAAPRAYAQTTRQLHICHNNTQIKETLL
jgi:hypothetical protein